MANDKVQIKFFREFQEADILNFIKFTKQCYFKEGDIIFNQNDKSEMFFIIYSGKVEVFATDIKEEEIKFITLGAGNIIGEIGFLDGKKRTASVKALADTHALMLSYTAFIHIEEDLPYLAMLIHKELGKILAERLRMCDKILINHSMVKINDNFLLNLIRDNEIFK
jgi:CRP/FNR family cyclic AMP-dependent transcriptional regulator